MIKNYDFEKFGLEKLKGLKKILPEVDEIDIIRAFDGDKKKLGVAEQFIFDLI